MMTPDALRRLLAEDLADDDQAGELVEGSRQDVPVPAPAPRPRKGGQPPGRHVEAIAGCGGWS